MERLRYLVLAFVAGLIAVVGCIGGDPNLVGEGQTWTEADEMFRSDERWLGADGAFSIDLGDERVLWLFGDTLVAPEGERSREEAFFVSNTVAIQEGYDPETASITFHWRPPVEEDESPLPSAVSDQLEDEDDDPPRAFFPDEDGIAHWPQHGVVTEEGLLVFAHRIDRGDGGQFGFENRGWVLFHIEEPRSDPSDWRIEVLAQDEPFARQTNVSLGTSVIRKNGELYVFGTHSWEDEGGWTHHEAVLARWSVEDALAGDVEAQQWWDPERSAWVADDELDHPPSGLIEPAAPSYSIAPNPTGEGWVQTQTTGFGDAPLDARTAPDLAGPWSQQARVYEPPEGEDPAIMTYAGLAHPHLEGADLVLTYSTNAMEGEETAEHEDAYYPRAVKVDLETR